MADYTNYSRTNYFQVTDIAKFRELMSRTEAEVWEKTIDGKVHVGAGAYDTIDSYYDERKDEYVSVYAELQTLLPDGEVAIFQEIGYEKLRYLAGVAVIVTNTEIRTVDITHDALKLAAEMTGKPEGEIHRPEY